MAAPFSLTLKLNLKTLKAGLGEVRRGLRDLTRVSVGNAFAPAIAGAKNFARAAREAQFALAAVGAAATGALLKITNIGSDLEENLSKAQAVFKDFTGEALEFSKDLAKEVGRSELEILKFATAMQDTFVPLGFARSEALKLSKEITKLAIDLGSFNNVADADVLRDIQSALVGNTETVRKYGIVITEAAIKQRAFQDGLDPKALTEQEKVAIRLKLIFEGTADAQGDAARTALSFANQLKALKAQFLDLLAAVGSEANKFFLPFIERTREALRTLQDFVSQSPEVAGRIASISAAVLGVLAAASSLAFVIGPLIPLFGSLVSAAAGVIAPFLSIKGALLAIVGVIPALIGAGGLFAMVQVFRQLIKEAGGFVVVFQNIKTGLVEAFAGLKEIGASIVEPIRDFAENVVTRVFNRIEDAGTRLNNFFISFGVSIRGVFEGIASTLRNVLGNAFAFIEPIAVQAIENVIKIMDELPVIVNAVSASVGEMVTFIADMFGIMLGDTQRVGEGFTSLRDIAVSALQAIQDFLTSETFIKAFGYVRLAVAGITTGISLMSNAAKIFGAIMTTLIARVLQGLGKLLDTLGIFSDTLKSLGSDVGEFARRLIDEAERQAKEADESIRATFDRAREEAINAINQIENAETIAANSKARIQQRREVLEALKEEADIIKTTAKFESFVFKERLKQFEAVKELSNKQAQELQKSSRAALDVLLNQISAAKSSEDLAKAVAEHERKMQDLNNELQQQAHTNRIINEDQKARTKATEAEAKTQKEAKETAEKRKDVEQELNKIVDRINESRVRSTETLRDDLALLESRKQKELALEKDIVKRQGIVEKFELKRRALIDERIRKEREAASEALRDISDRAKAFDDFAKSIERAFQRRQGKDIEVRVDEIGEEFLEQIKNITSLQQLNQLPGLLAKALNEPLEDAKERANNLKEELRDLGGDLKEARQEGDRGRIVDLQNEIRAKQGEVARAERRINNLINETNTLQQEIVQQAQQREAEIQRLQQEKAAAQKRIKEQQRLDKEGVEIIDPAKFDEAQKQALEAVNKSVDAMKQAQELAANSATAAANLAEANTSLATQIKDFIAPLRERVAEVLNAVRGFAQNLGVFETVNASLLAIVNEQRTLTNAIDTLGTTLIAKFGEVQQGFKTQTNKINNLSNQIAAIRLDPGGDGPAGFDVF